VLGAQPAQQAAILASLARHAGEREYFDVGEFASICGIAARGRLRICEHRGIAHREKIELAWCG